MILFQTFLDSTTIKILTSFIFVRDGRIIAYRLNHNDPFISPLYANRHRVLEYKSRCNFFVTSEQVGGEHHVLELGKIKAIEQAVIQVVHIRERTVIVQPRSEVVQVRQVTGVAQSVIQALVLAQ